MIGIIAKALIFGKNININNWMMPVKNPHIKHLVSVGFVLKNTRSVVLDGRVKSTKQQQPRDVPCYSR